MMVREGLNCSRKFRITAGVPQGGISSLSLFKFYLSDIPIPKYTKESGSVFADDCVSWAFGYNAQQAAESVQFFLNGFEAWCKAWRTIPEPSKSNAIIFSRNPNIRKQKFTLTLLGENIPQVKKVTFLGVDLEETITWKANTDKMIGKAASTINSIKKSCSSLGKAARILSMKPLMLYLLAFSHIPAQCILTWQNANGRRLKPCKIKRFANFTTSHRKLAQTYYLKQLERRLSGRHWKRKPPEGSIKSSITLPISLTTFGTLRTSFTSTNISHSCNTT